MSEIEAMVETDDGVVLLHLVKGALEAAEKTGEKLEEVTIEKNVTALTRNDGSVVAVVDRSGRAAAYARDIKRILRKMSRGPELVQHRETPPARIELHAP